MVSRQHVVINFVRGVGKDALCVSIQLSFTPGTSQHVKPELWDYADHLMFKINEILLSVIHARLLIPFSDSFAHASVHYVCGDV